MTESSSDSKKKKQTEDGIFKQGSVHDGKEDKTDAPLSRRSSISYQGPLGNVSVGGTWEQRRQKLAQFSCSLYFIMPASIICWVVTIGAFVKAALCGRTNTTCMVTASLMAVYLGFIFVVDNSEKTGSRTPFLRDFRSWWNASCDYLPLTLVKTADLPPSTEKGGSNNYVLGYHPHGIISVGCFGGFATDGARTLDLTKKTKTDNDNDKNEDDSVVQRGFSSLFPGLDRRVVTLPQNFGTPFMREYFLHMGAVTSAKETFRSVLAKPNSALIVVVGGATESLETQQGAMDLVLEHRRGFVREAIMGHASLVPVLGFGENDLYHMVDTTGWKWIPKAQDLVKKYMGFAMPIFAGRSILFRDFGVMPERRPVVVVVGEPIPPPPLTQVKNPKEFKPLIDRKTDEPLNEDGKILKEHHAKYIEALEAMYGKYKNAPWNIPGIDRRQSLRIIK